MNRLAAGEGLDFGAALTDTAAGITANMGSALPIALGVAGTIVAVTIGWKIFRRFVKG